MSMEVMRVIDVGDGRRTTAHGGERMLDARELITTLGMLIVGVNGCKDMSSRMILVDINA